MNPFEIDLNIILNPYRDSMLNQGNSTGGPGSNDFIEDFDINAPCIFIGYCGNILLTSQGQICFKMKQAIAAMCKD